MRVFPHTLESDQSLYTVIPLALDLDNIHSYFPHLKTSFGDCQFFSTQELPHTNFSYMDSTYSILNMGKSNKEEKTKKKIHTVPFTTLLVGPVYACREVLTTFNTWAKIDPESIMSPPLKKITSKQTNHKIQNKKSAINNICWLPIQHPSVWAQATFTTVTVTTAYPKSLERELQTIFQFPISVSAIPPVSTQCHNEFAAWLSSIYVLVASRNVYRTVFCHTNMWKNQLQFFSNVYNATPDIPETWKRLVNVPFLIKQVPSQHTNPNNPVVMYAKKISHYNIRKQTYKNKDSLLCRSIGIAMIQTPIIPKKVFDGIINQEDISIHMEYDTTQATITLPLLVSEEIMASIKQVVHQQLSIPLPRIIVALSPNESIALEMASENVPSYYTILLNLVIQMCKKPISKHTTSKKNIKKKISLSQCKFLYKQLTSTCVVMEFDINKYSRNIMLHKASIVCDVGYIANENRSYGIIEKHLFHSFFSLCGNNSTISKAFECKIEFLNSDTCVYSASCSTDIKHTVFHAVFDGLNTEHTPIQFPRKRFNDTTRTI